MMVACAECEPAQASLVEASVLKVSQEQQRAGQDQSAREGLSEPEDDEDDDDRHNFASAKDGAKIVAANKDAKKPSAILDSDSDTYLRNECKADKWLAVELSQASFLSGCMSSIFTD